MSPAPEIWQNLPHHIFGDIMTMMGRESLQDLQKGRQVCQSWNVMMSQMTKYEKATIRREAESQADQIREQWKFLSDHKPRLPDITTAASLAHHGMLSSVEFLSLRDVDLASVTTKLSSLTNEPKNRE